MKWVCVLLPFVAIVGCTVRKPVEHSSVSRTYEMIERNRLMVELSELLVANKIQVAVKDVHNGLIVTDSFDVLPEYCDCGLNFFGAEYPGQRRGVMKIKITGTKTPEITFDFKTKLRITANNKLVLCTSFGKLEGKLLDSLERRLAIAGRRAND